MASSTDVLNSLLVLFRHAFGKMLNRSGERAFVQWIAGDLLSLHGDFIEKIFRRHQMVFNAASHVFFNLFEGRPILMQPADVIVVIVHGREMRVTGRLRQREMDSVHLIDGHLPRLQAVRLKRIAQAAGSSVSDLIRLRRLSDENQLFKLAKKFAIALSIPCKCRGRVIAELRVVAVVSKSCRRFRAGLKLVLPFLR